MSQLHSVCFIHILNVPLYAISDKKTSLAAKVISAIAIAILSVVTFGFYCIHAYRFFDAKKVVNNGATPSKELGKDNANIEKVKATAAQLVKDGKLQDLLTLFKNHPTLKTLPLEHYALAKESGFNFAKIQAQDSGELFISELLIKAAQNGHYEIVKQLCEYGANVNNRCASRGNKTALDWAIQFRHSEVVGFLINEPNIQFSSEDLSNHLLKSAPELTSSAEDVKKYLNIIYLLIEKMANITSTRFSCIGLVVSYWDVDEETCKKIISLMIKKGDHLRDADQQLGIQSEAAKNFIKQENGYQV